MGVQLMETVISEVAATAASPSDDAQRTALERVIQHLTDHGVAALSKAGQPMHLTASCFVFDLTLRETLLTFHRKGQFWVQFGGHLEKDDPSLRGAAIRELHEESGIADAEWFSPLPLDVDIHDVSSAFGACRTHVDLAFGVVVPGSIATSVSIESDDLGWHAVGDLPAGSLPGLAARTARIRKLIRLERG